MICSDRHYGLFGCQDCIIAALKDLCRYNSKGIPKMQVSPLPVLGTMTRFSFNVLLLT